jgi:pyruvate kinase
MEQLVLAGANFFRSNFAHAQYDEYRERLAICKHLNEKYDTNVQMQADIQGTNIRTGLIGGTADGSMELIEGHRYVCVTNGGEVGPGEIPINDTHLHTEVKAGHAFTFSDGAIEGEVISVEGNRITVEVNNSGILKSRKSINVPETDLDRSCITDKDKADIEFLSSAGINWIAVSFVASANEMHEVRELMKGSDVKLMAKLERKKAMENLNEIVLASDGVMIARGDLGIELPLEDIPVLTREIINASHAAGKPVVTATQMMLSMTHAHRPTRAEASDVAHAVFDGTDAVMLSEETAAGNHPVLALETMVRIVRRAEDFRWGIPNRFDQFGL